MAITGIPPVLKEYLDFEAHSHINTDSDSEIMLQLFSCELFQKNKRRVDVQDLSIGLERCSLSVESLLELPLLEPEIPTAFGPLSFGLAPIRMEKAWITCWPLSPWP